ncbi:MAG: hypothetical protein OHK003_09710 [Anaerolineales bacterium]
MFAMKKFDPKLTLLQIILIYACFSLLLSACNVTTSCGLQAVAGGAQHCEQLEIGE